MKDVRSPVKLCEMCAKSKKTSRLKLYQVNFEEAILLCENNECTYPLGYSDSADLVVQRKFTEVVIRKRASGSESSRPCALNRHLTQGLSSFSRSANIGLDKQTRLPTVRSTPVLNRFDEPKNISILEQISRNIQEQKNKSDSLKKTTSDSLKKSTNAWAPYIPGQSSYGSSPSVCKNVQPSVAIIEPVGKLVKMSEVMNCAKKTEKTTVFQSEIIENGILAESPVVCHSPDDLVKESKSPNKSLDTATCKSKTTFGMHKFHRSDRFPQWQNKDALCWLDVVLCLLVHNKTLEFLCQTEACMESCVLFTLLKAYRQAKSFTKKIKLRSKHTIDSKPCVSSSDACTFRHGIPADNDSPKNSCEKTIFQTGAGPQVLVPFMNIADDSTSDSDSFDGYECPEVNKIMNSIREDVWSTLEPKLHCEKGRSNSPVSALQWMLKENPKIGQILTVTYELSFLCRNCSHREVLVEETILPSVSSPKGIGEEIVSVQSCSKCGGSGLGKWTFKRLPDVHLMHFVEGIPHTDFSKLDIHHHGNRYTVTGVVQYKNNPDHFVLWIRDPTDDHWMECDDLKSLMCEFHPQPPKFAANQVHIVMWEKVHENKKESSSFNGTCKPDLQISESKSCPVLISASSVTCNSTVSINGSSSVHKVTEKGKTLNSNCQQSTSSPLSHLKYEAASIGQELMGFSNSSQVETYLVVTSPVKNKSNMQINPADIQQLVLPEKLSPGKFCIKSPSDYTKILNVRRNNSNSSSVIHTTPNLVILSSGGCSTPISVQSLQQGNTNASVVQVVSDAGNPVLSYYAQHANKQTTKANSAKCLQQRSTRPALDHLNKIQSNLSLLRLQKHKTGSMQSSLASSVSQKGHSAFSDSTSKREYHGSCTKKDFSANDGNNTVDNSNNAPYLAALKPFLQKVPKASPSTNLNGRHSFAGYTLQCKNVQVSGAVGKKIVQQTSDLKDNRKRKLTTAERGPPKKKSVDSRIQLVEIEQEKVQREVQHGSNNERRDMPNSQECDILKNLYDALNLTFPAASSDS